MTRVQLTINGVPDFRAELARKSERQWAEAAKQIGHEPKEPCFWILVDKLKERPNVYFYWDRAERGYIDPDTAFGPIANERIPGSGFTITPKGGEPKRYEFFRYEVHFGTVVRYKPATQAELDERAIKREARKREADAAKDRAAFPLFAP